MDQWLRRWGIAVLLLGVVVAIRNTNIIGVVTLTAAYWAMCAFLITMGWLIRDLNRDE